MILCTVEDPGDRRFDVRMADGAGVAEGCGEVVRADQDRVDPGHGQDRVEVVEGLARLDLDAARHQLVGGAHVLCRVPPVLGRSARSDPAQSDRRIAAPGHGPLGVGDGPDLGNDDATRSGVERVHDPDGLVGGHAVEQGHAGGAERDEHLDEVRRRDRTVLAVGDEEVEPGTGHAARARSDRGSSATTRAGSCRSPGGRESWGPSSAGRSSSSGAAYGATRVTIGSSPMLPAAQPTRPGPIRRDARGIGICRLENRPDGRAWDGSVGDLKERWCGRP